MFIDKRTGVKTFQVYEWMTYGGGWRFYQTANFETPAGPVSVTATQISKDVNGCSNGCDYTEHVAFTVDEALLRSLAAAYVPGKPAIWLYKFIGKAGPDFEDGLSNAEIAGCLAKVDEYMTAHRIAVTAAKTELGIVVAPLPPTPQDPNRAGLLVVQVKDHSVAQNATLLVGDIITDFAGVPVRQSSDLQSTLGAVAPGSAVSIKLIRGAANLTVTAQF